MSKEYKTLLRAKVDINIMNVIEIIKNNKSTEETGVILKMLLMESPTFAREYENTLRFLGKV